MSVIWLNSGADVRVDQVHIGVTVEYVVWEGGLKKKINKKNKACRIS